MSNLLLKIDAGSGYEDGDILCAFSRRAIRCVHAQNICHPRHVARNGSGLLPVGSLPFRFMNLTNQYRFSRLDARTVQRTDIQAGTSDVITARPNPNGEYMNVRQFIARRRKNPNNLLFGEDGSEIWFGGKVTLDGPAVREVWKMIKNRTAFDDAQPEFRHWPMGTVEQKSHLPLGTDDFGDDLAHEMQSPDVEFDPVDGDDPRPRLIKKRKHDVPWRDVLEMTAADIEKARDKGRRFDLRQERAAYARSVIVRRKQRG